MQHQQLTALFDAEPKAIAEQGFQFLLLDTYSQLWLLLQQYIANAQQKAGVQHFQLPFMYLLLLFEILLAFDQV